MTVTDTIVTIMDVRNAGSLFTALERAAAGWGTVAAAEGVATTATLGLAGAVGALELAMAPLLGAIALLAGAAGALVKVTGAFSESEASLARTALQLKTLPGSIPIGELVEFSNRMQDLTGINHDVIASLGATASQFGETKSQIEKLIPTVLDISQAKGLDPEAVLTTLLRAGKRPQGLIALGINPDKIKGDLHDINNLVNQVGKGFAGVAVGFRDTLPGSLNALGSSMTRLFESIGRLLSPVLVPILNLLDKAARGWTLLFDRIASFLHLPTSADLGAGGATASLAFKGDPEQTEYQKQIAHNTKKTHDALIQGVLGGPGTVARGAFTVRDARVAFGI